MTEPDEALLWAREHWAKICEEDDCPDEAEAYRQGMNDESLATDAQAYRAGAAASDARIKALEEKNAAFAKRIKALKGAIDQLLSAYEHLDSYEVKSTELWAAYHFALNIYGDFVWSPEANAIDSARLLEARPMTGFVATLTAEQKQAAMTYEGDDHHGLNANAIAEEALLRRHVLRCINAHDRCFEGGPCPLCEIVPWKEKDEI